MSAGEFWNYVNIVVIMVAIGFNVGYWYVHVNGKKYIRLWIGIILTLALVIRLMLAFGVLNEVTFTDWYRPLAVLVNFAFCLGPYIDWGMPKIQRGKHDDK